jgi:hypothetical protein
MRYKVFGYVLWKVGNRFLRPRYEILGFVVWNGGKWYLRRRFGEKPRKIAAAGVVGVALATGVAMAARQVRSSSS